MSPTTVSTVVLVVAVLSIVVIVYGVCRWRQIASGRNSLRSTGKPESDDYDRMTQYRRRVAAFPTAIREAHKHSSNHRLELAGSTLCGCFYCCQTFSPTEIRDWVDPADDDLETGTTALCPFCGIDSVIGDRSGFPVTSEFLQQLNKYWF